MFIINYPFMQNSVIKHTRQYRSGFYSLKIFFLFFSCFIFFINFQLIAQGNLLVYPQRVVFEGQKKVIEVNIANPSKDSVKYSLSFLQYRSTVDGGYEKITTPDSGQYFADKNIRFLPRTVKLGPSETQVVLLQLIRSEQLKPGEYRSHLYLKALRDQKYQGDFVTKKDSSILGIKIVPTFSITIPILIQKGESTTTVYITDLKLETASDGSKKLLCSINRSGNMSAYGDISILHFAPNGKETKIGLLNAVSVYTPNLIRKLKINLENKTSVDMSKGTIRVLYSLQSEKRLVKLAGAELAL